MAIKITKVVSSEGQAFLNAIHQLQNKNCKVGWIDKSHYPYRPSNKGPVQPPTVAEIARTHEFGYAGKNIPPRPFMRPTITEKENSWRKIAKDGSVKMIKNQLTAVQVMEGIGQKSAGDIKSKIRRIFSPALKEQTILARIRRNSKLSKIKGRFSESAIGGITKPLIDTGLMFATLIFEVGDE